MATDTSAPQKPAVEKPRPSATGMIVGLFWGGAMTVLLALWLGRKYTLPGFYPPVLYVLALAFAGLAVWHCVTRWRQPGDAARLDAQLKIIRSFLIGAGIFFACSGGYLLYAHGPVAVGEGVGMILFGGLCALGGLMPAAPATEGSSRFLTYVQENTRHLGRILLAVCAGLILFYYILFFNGLATSALLPELLGLAMIVLLCAGVGAYLVTADGPLTSVAARIVFLMLGGFIGLALFVAVVGRTLAWRETTLFGGLAAWQGENAWRLWLCAYAGMLALGLMTASLLLARADIRSSPVLRRVLYGFNTVVTALLLVLVLVICNIVVYAMAPFQFDWTSNRGVYSLAESSKQLLSRLDKPVKGYLVIPGGRERTEYQDLYNFLENCEALTPKFTYKHLSQDTPAHVAEAINLGERFPVIAKSMSKFARETRRGGLLLVYGEIPADPNKTPPHGFVPIAEMFEDDRADKKRGGKAVTQTFKGEAEVMKHISSFMTQKKAKIYFLQDHGELDIFSTEATFKPRLSDFTRSIADSGAAKLRKFLVESNFEVFGLSFADGPAKDRKEGMVYAPKDADTNKRAVPKDADFVIAAGPSLPIPEETLAALGQYLDGGGKMIAMFDLFTDAAYTTIGTTGLEELLKRYGVEVTQDYVVVDWRQPHFGFATPPRDDNEVVQMFQKKFFVVPFARVVKKGLPGKHKVDHLLLIDPEFRVPVRDDLLLRQSFVVESKPAALKNPVGYLSALEESGRLKASLATEPVSMAVMVSPSEDAKNKPQIYVFGDADIVSDAMQGNEFGETNFDLIRTCLETSMDRPGFRGPRPRRVTNYMPDEKTNYASMAVVPGWIMTICLFALGAGLWLVRRR